MTTIAIATGTNLIDIIQGIEHNQTMLKFSHALGSTALNAAIFTAKALIAARSYEAKQRLDAGVDVIPTNDMRNELDDAETPTIMAAFAKLNEDPDYIRTLDRIERLQASMTAAARTYNMIYETLREIPGLTQYDRPNSINEQLEFLTNVSRADTVDMEAAKLDALNTGLSLEEVIALAKNRQVRDMLDLKVHRDEIRTMILACGTYEDTDQISAVTQLKWAVKTADRVLQRLTRDGMRAMQNNSAKRRAEVALSKTFIQPVCTTLVAWMEHFAAEHKDEIAEAEANGFEIPELNIEQIEIDATKLAIKRLEEETLKIREMLAA